MTAWLLIAVSTAVALPAVIFVLLVVHTRRATTRESVPRPPLQLSESQTRLLTEQIAARNERRRALDPHATEILFPPWLIPASSDADDRDETSPTNDQAGL